MGKIMINGEQYPSFVVKTGLDDSSIVKDKTWSSSKINEELEDVRGELDIIVEEANKNTSINDEVESLTTVWSSKKTSNELATKQENMSVRKVYARRNSSANKYILLATIDMSKITYIGQPLRIKGVIGNMASDITNIDLVINARNGFVKKILSGTVTHKNFLTNDANIIITKSDDEKTAYVYLYCISTYGYIDAEIYLGSVHYSVPSTFDLVETMQGTEYTNLLDTNYVVIENVINDTTSSETSTYSSAKIDEKISDTAKLVYFSRAANRGYLKITNADDGRPISISDICGGKIEIYGNGRVVASDNNYFAKVLRLSYGNWTTFDATKDTVTYKKIFKTYLDETNKTFYVEVGSNTRFCVEGAKTVEMLELDDVDIAQFTEIPESQFASKSDLGSNMALTNITFDSTYATATSGGHGCTYVIRNGICYVNMDMRIVANGKICTLPKPLMSVVNIPMTVFMHNITGEVEAVNNGILMVTSDGSATTLGALTNESRYMMNFSYPIA